MYFFDLEYYNSPYIFRGQFFLHEISLVDRSFFLSRFIHTPLLHVLVVMEMVPDNESLYSRIVLLREMFHGVGLILLLLNRLLLMFGHSGPLIVEY